MDRAEWIGTLVVFFRENLLVWGFLGVFLLGVFLSYFLFRRQRRRELLGRINRCADQVASFASLHFAIHPCERCLEATVRVLKVTPNARSLLCECTSCGTEQFAPAASTEAPTIIRLVKKLADLQDQYPIYARKIRRVQVSIECSLPHQDLPFQEG